MKQLFKTNAFVKSDTSPLIPPTVWIILSVAAAVIGICSAALHFIK